MAQTFAPARFSASHCLLVMLCVLHASIRVCSSGPKTNIRIVSSPTRYLNLPISSRRSITQPHDGGHLLQFSAESAHSHAATQPRVPLPSFGFFSFLHHAATVLQYQVVISHSINKSYCQKLFVIMTVSGLSGSSSRCWLQLPPYHRGRGSLHVQVTSFSVFGKHKQEKGYLQVERLKCSTRQIQLVKSAMDASYGDMANESTAVFPRINVKDPYKRLGISREASEDEIQAARNFLIQKYAGHKPSVDAIESAHDKIIMQKFYARRNPKIDIKKKIREVNQSRFVQAVRGRFHTPSTKFIIKTLVAFLLLGILTVIFPTEEGPTLQVAISLLATMYFVYDRLKSKIRALLYGAGAFIVSWLLGTFLMVSVIPPIPILKGPRTFEVLTSLITYVLLWVSSTYLR